MTASSVTTTSSTSTFTGWAAIAGGAASAVAGAVQAVRTDDGNPIVGTSEHVLLALVAAALVLWAPGYLALGRGTGTRPGRAGGAAAALGCLLLAFGATATNLHDQDYTWFPAVAVPANAAWLAGSIILAVSTWRRRTLPRAASAALPLVWLTSIILSQAGGNLIAGAVWVCIGWLLVIEARHSA